MENSELSSKYSPAPILATSILPGIILSASENCRSKYYFDESSFLGQGSCGRVFKGRCTNSDEYVAIKHVQKANPLLAAATQDELMHKQNEHVKFLKQEIHTLQPLDHPNIIKLLDSFEDFRNFYLVMQLCAGGKLKDYGSPKGGAVILAERDTSVAMQQVLTAVKYIHGRHICHRDIKPDNMMLASRGPIESNTVKIIDFGYACKCMPGQYLHEVAGTPYYMAPEVVNKHYDKSADVWSCGVVMYHLLSGRKPFDAATADGVLALVRRGNFSFGGDVWNSVSSDATDLIRLLMNFDYKARLSAEDALCHTWISQRAPRAAWTSIF